MVPGLQGLTVWSRPAEEIYLAGPDAAGCVMTQEDCAIGKQTTTAQPSSLLPFPTCWQCCERWRRALHQGDGSYRGATCKTPSRIVWPCLMAPSLFFPSFPLLKTAKWGSPMNSPLPPMPPHPFPSAHQPDLSLVLC